ncbi:MAG: Ty1/Copia family ribonuclease HI, partial [Marinobacter sp.]
MEAEYNALAMAMKDLLPLQTLFATIGRGIALSDEIITTFKTTVWEDNMGCLKLAKMAPGQYTPRSKHYAVKYHWFRSKLEPSRTTIEYIKTTQQKADI